MDISISSALLKNFMKLPPLFNVKTSYIYCVLEKQNVKTLLQNCCPKIDASLFIVGRTRCMRIV
jgi:hypothetical protein